MMTEAEFSSLIECRFPYRSREESIRLIELACSISTNAAFMVADELARPPRSLRVSKRRREALLGELDSRFEHALKQSVFPIVRRRIAGAELTIPEAVAAIRRIGSHPGQYAALVIAYMSADDVTGEVDEAYQEVLASWRLGA